MKTLSLTMGGNEFFGYSLLHYILSSYFRLLLFLQTYGRNSLIQLWLENHSTLNLLAFRSTFRYQT